MLRPSIDNLKQLIRNFRDLDKILINQGRLLSKDYNLQTFNTLQDSEFQVFSQWGEDGIIQYLTRNIEISHKTFIEFGVETFTEANCRFLMQKDFWQGMVIDGSAKNIAKIQQSYYHWRHQLTAIEAFISRDNISGLIAQAPFDEIGILSVDIDGVDYFVLEALEHLRPSIIIVEYNGIFGSEAKVSVPYSPDFQRHKAHHSNLYYGASINAFDHLLSKRGYALVGGNSAGNNAFFVRNDRLNEKVRAVSVAEAYRAASFSEARNANGDLTFVRGKARRDVIGHLPLVEVATGQQLTVSEITSS